ncbi:glycolate oxidase iron-sulfur subunit [Salinibacillus kushneri]|uniref:Glycolate oxidase iron-sulfur subunit n=1 Tax=Salinibacillus kushneri TaxID=237682 RepID=A0A1I0EWM3_9BACI|nr:(Fe-S)-binding protein [Salinibacillus kushneri]SET49899.1 glycolate oxidase iron-sulfur subunit [Salinibacillus kushneri]
MNTHEKARIQEEFQQRMDYDELLNCMRCGFCLPSCPTYLETGKDEAHSPRGRIALMKGVVDGNIEPDEEVKKSLDMCLGCRACEPVCPSGVNYGHLLEEARDIIYQNQKTPFFQKIIRKIAFKGLFPKPKRLRRLTSLLRFYQKSKLQKIVRTLKLTKILPSTYRLMEKVLPVVPKMKEAEKRQKVLEPFSKKKKRVAFFTGCLMDSMFLSTNQSTIKLLQYAGCEVVIPDNQICCGALHGHSGEKEQAKEMAKKNIEAFENLNVDYIITNAGGCGAFLNDYHHLLKDEEEWTERATSFDQKIKDISSLLVELNFHKQSLKLPYQIVTYQDSCHLKNGQQTFMEPRQLLDSVQGTDYVEMKDASRCCGSAGIYNLVQTEMSMKILDYKMKQTRATHANVIVTANPGCLLQMKMGIEKEGLADKMRAVHIVDYLVEAYEYSKNERVS